MQNGENVLFDVKKGLLNEEEIFIITFKVNEMNDDIIDYILETTRYDIYRFEENLPENVFEFFVIDEEDIEDCVDDIREVYSSAIENYNSNSLFNECPKHYREFLVESEDIFRYKIDDIISEISDRIAEFHDDKILSEKELERAWLDYIDTDVYEKRDCLNEYGKDVTIYNEYLEKIEKMYSD